LVINTPVERTAPPLASNTPVERTAPPLASNTPVERTAPPLATNTPVERSAPTSNTLDENAANSETSTLYTVPTEDADSEVVSIVIDEHIETTKRSASFGSHRNDDSARSSTDEMTPPADDPIVNAADRMAADRMA